MAYGCSDGKQNGKWEGGMDFFPGAPDSGWMWKMNGLTIDVITEHNSRDRTLWREWEHEKFQVPSLADHNELMPSLLNGMNMHTFSIEVQISQDTKH